MSIVSPEFEDREAGVALNRTGAVAAVWRGSRIAILDGRDGRELRVVHAPIGVERMSLSDDGTRLAAGLEDRGERRSGIGVWDTASGRLAAIVPPREAAWRPQIVWIGDDVIACAPRLPGGDPEVCFTVISRLETRRFHYAILVSPIVANSGGTVVAVANGFEFVLVLNTGDMGELSSDLATDFCPSVIVAMAISDDGATVATCAETITPMSRAGFSLMTGGVMRCGRYGRGAADVAAGLRWQARASRS